jgi:hypothetical protein
VINSSALYIYKDIETLVSLHHICVLVSPIKESRGLKTQVRHMAPLWWGASTVDGHDRGLPREGHHVAFI